MTFEDAVLKRGQFREKNDAYHYALALSNWDRSTLAPKKGRMEGAKLFSILSGEYYSFTVSDDFREVLKVLEENKDRLSKVEKRELELNLDEIKKLEAIPKDQYEKYQEVRSKSGIIWEEAKNEGDFLKFSPYLKEIIAYKRSFVKLTHPEFSPYDACIDDYEKGTTIKDLDVFFEKVKAVSVPLIEEIMKNGRKIESRLSGKKFSREKQMEVSEKLLELIGFDMDYGVIKESAHPFTTTLNREDVRLTTHYHENRLVSSIFSTIHEGGHGIYNQNMSRSKLLKGSSLNVGASNGIHESQSRFYENTLGRNQSFWEYFYPTLNNIFSKELEGVSCEDFYQEVNIVEPGLIRIEADELTYNLHIIIRYEIERDLMEGKIQVEDLPEIWNEKYFSYLGVRPKNDGEGVLQDVHWSGGMVGYFPSYSMGNAYAAQLSRKMEKELDLENLLKTGDFLPVKNWMNEKVHSHGKLKTPGELILEATGEKLNPDYLTTYLKDKYEKIYF